MIPPTLAPDVNRRRMDYFNISNVHVTCVFTLYIYTSLRIRTLKKKAFEGTTPCEQQGPTPSMQGPLGCLIHQRSLSMSCPTRSTRGLRSRFLRAKRLSSSLTLQATEQPKRGPVCERAERLLKNHGSHTV